MKKFLLLSLAIFLNAGISLQAQNAYRDISVQQSDSLIKVRVNNPDFVLLDIRTQVEYDKSHLENSKMVNYLTRKGKREIFRLDKEKSYLIYCRSGKRSAALLKKMKRRHFSKVYNMLGGIRDWMKNEYPVVAGELHRTQNK